MSTSSSLPPLQWNQLTLDAIRLTNAPPPVAARALVMVHTAVFDAWSLYSKCAVSTTTARYLKRCGDNCSEQDLGKTIHYAAFRVLTYLFWSSLPGEKQNMFRDRMTQYNLNPDDCSMDISTPSGAGNLIAKLILDYREGDESNQKGMLYHFGKWQDFSGYQPVNLPEPSRAKDIGRWQPLCIDTQNQNFLLPHWSLVRPFALVHAGQFRPGPPFDPKGTSQEFKKQLQEVLCVSENLSDKEKAVAEYWDDNHGANSIVGHWCEIARFICEREKYGVRDCAKLFFVLTNAMLDTTIACWECKRHYDSARPVTAIHELYRGKLIRAWGGPFKGTVEMDGSDWMPYQRPEIVTPPFPEYVSIHSAVSRAAASVLYTYTKKESFNGCFLVKKCSSLIEPGKTPSTDVMLQWPTLTAAADEAGISGLYSGVHFRKAIEAGKNIGACVAKSVWERAAFYFGD